MSLKYLHKMIDTKTSREKLPLVKKSQISSHLHVHVHYPKNESRMPKHLATTTNMSNESKDHGLFLAE
jgi:hypothetical protein